MFRNVRSDTLLVILFQGVILAAAQTLSNFEWSFAGQTAPTSFQECQEVPLFIEPQSDHGGPFGVTVPPYFLIAFELGGVPTMTNVGSDRNNLSWRADHTEGSNLLLTMTDSQNNIGSLSTTLFTMSKGSNKSCIPTASSAKDLPSITPNVTGKLATCEPWGLQINGGKKPYTLYLTAWLAPVVTVIQIGPNEDFYAYVNRAGPGTLLSVAVLDGNNQWGVSPQPVRTVGSTDTSCGNLQSVSGGDPIQSGSTTLPSSSRNSLNVPVTAGLAAGLGILILLALGTILWWCCHHRNTREHGEKGDQDAQHDIIAPQASASALSPYPRSLSPASMAIRAPKGLAGAAGGGQDVTDVRPANTPSTSAYSASEDLQMVAPISLESPSPEIRPRDEGQGAAFHTNDSDQDRATNSTQELPPPYTGSVSPRY